MVVKLHGHGEPPPHTEKTSSGSTGCSGGGRRHRGAVGLTEAEGAGGEGEGGGERGGGRRALLFQWTVLKEEMKQIIRQTNWIHGSIVS